VGFTDLLENADRAVRQVLGSAITYTPGVGSPVTVQGVFDAAYVRADAGQAGVSTASPAVFLRLSELPTDPREDSPTVTVGGVDYSVHEVEPDGLGGVRLLLHLE
jgi:hypothetical protein